MAENLPVVTWPVVEAYRRLYPDRVSILEPVFPDPPRTRRENFVLYSGGKIDCLIARTGHSAWPAPVDCRSQPLLLGASSGLFVFATPHRVFAVGSTTGQSVWSIGEDPPDDPSSDPEALENWARHILLTDRLFCLSNRGWLSCILVRDGSLLWRGQTEGGVGSQLSADADRLFLTERRGSESVIVVLDARTGQEVRTLRSGGRGLIEQLIPADDRALLVVMSGMIVSLDSESGRENSRIEPSRRLAVPTLQITGQALFASDEVGRISKYDLATGNLRWRTPALGDKRQGSLWMKAAHGVLYAASPDRLFSIDAADGQPRWQHATPKILEAQPPSGTRDSIVTFAQEPRRSRAASQPDDFLAGQGSIRYVVRAYDHDGRELPVTSGGPEFVTEPLPSFGGLFLRDGCLVLLDGNRLIGYVEQPAATQRGVEKR